MRYLVIPDGSGVVMYLRMRGKPAQRYPGIELAESLLQQAGKLPNSEQYFSLEVPRSDGGGGENLAAKRLTVVDCFSTRLSFHEEEKDFRESLKKMQPKLIFVGLGVPRQEFWIAKHRHLCPQSIWWE
jgi:N-acetylglucosaminyldiphosphoundecaprenol N-acetyl-beta-D-mannosaminyltransferase